MNTKQIPQPERRRLKRKARKLARLERRGAPSTLQLRQAAHAYSLIRARIAELPELEPPAGWQERAHERARREGVFA